MLSLALVLAWPTDALAWGPGVHLALGNMFLSNPSLLAAPVATALAAHPNAFLYGSVAADIFIGKGVRQVAGHSHAWEVGRVLSRATDGRAMAAFAYGYLAHLAADVAAHNYYVPNQLAVAPLRGKMSHVYLEVQADAQVEWDRRQAMRLFSRSRRPQDLALLGELGKHKISFLLKKSVYKESVSLSGRRQWSDLARRAARLLPLPENEVHLARMLDLSQALVADVLAHPVRAAAFGFDPIGAENQAAVRSMGRRVSGRYAHARLVEDLPFPVDAVLAELPLSGGLFFLPHVERRGRSGP